MDYDLNEIRRKLESDEIPQSYIEWALKRVKVRYLTAGETERLRKATFDTIYPKRSFETTRWYYAQQENSLSAH